jgi:D-alanyl-D-alanine carboxypeptidase
VTTPAARTRRRWRNVLILSALLVVLVVAEVFLAGLYPARLLRSAVHCASGLSRRIDDQLRCQVEDSVGNDSSVHSIQFAVARGDGSYSWAGAAGIADPQHHTPATADTPVYLASVTKIYIATLVMQLSQQKLLALDNPMSMYLPAAVIRGIDVYQGRDYSSTVTIRDLVSMTSGIPDYYEEKGRDGKKMLDVFLADPGRTWTPQEMIDRARTDLTPHFAPGNGLYYSDTNYQLLGLIIESVTHTSLSTALQDHLFQPLGLHRTWLVGSTVQNAATTAPAHVFADQHDITTVRSKDYWADGGLVSTPTEMVAFLRALNEGKIISVGSLRTMQTWHDRDDSPTPPIPGVQYGYGLWHFDPTGVTGSLSSVEPTWGASGSTGSFLYYSAAHDVYLAGSVNSTSSIFTPFVLMGATMIMAGDT